MEVAKLEQKSRQLRRDILKMITKAGSGHPGGSLSALDAMVALYYYKMRIDPSNPKDMGRDRFVLSKGHAAPALYTILADKGFFPKEELDTFRQFGSHLQGHPDKKKLAGVEASTGSLGQGISMATGMALGAKAQGMNTKVYSIVGDGELEEGIVWEAAMAAAHYKLDNLTVIIDNNGLQIDGPNEKVMSSGNIADKYRAFGFEVLELEDGNDMASIIKALDTEVSDKPKCIVAHTVKGKGVSFMENEVSWHGKVPSAEQLEQALSELKGER